MWTKTRVQPLTVPGPVQVPVTFSRWNSPGGLALRVVENHV
ncbi:hypothetical protein [Streptomyces bluensis]|uniref:Uncharacterized protein n=1 Tax=Streptomyces bluensis TaxID=33897 RepID=A0ABW6UW10_9ACTN